MHGTLIHDTSASSNFVSKGPNKFVFEAGRWANFANRNVNWSNSDRHEWDV